MSADLNFISKAVDAGAAAGESFGFEKAKLRVVMLLLEEMGPGCGPEQTSYLTKLIGKVRQLQDVQP
jgi:hypothetical protein